MINVTGATKIHICVGYLLDESQQLEERQNQLFGESFSLTYKYSPASELSIPMKLCVSEA